MSDVTPDEYEKRWNQHIGELTRIGWHLGAGDQEKLEDLKNELRLLVVEAKKDVMYEDFL